MSISFTSIIEAVLFAHAGAMSKKRLASLLDISATELKNPLKQLHEDLENRGLALIETEDEVELRTSPDAASAVKKLRESELSRDLGKAGLETLALVMYKNGATRSEIDFIRGVNSTAALRSLLMRGLIERKEVENDRRKARYDITPEALAHLGISKVDALPRFAQFSSALADRGTLPEPESET